MQNMPENNRSDDFGHPNWERLSREEQIQWLQHKIQEQLDPNSKSEKDDDFLARCMDELDRLTPGLSMSEDHLEYILKKTRLKGEEQPHTGKRRRAILRLITTLLIAILMINAMIPPSYTYALEAGYDFSHELQAEPRQIVDIRLNTINYGENDVLLARQLADKEERLANMEPYSITYWSLEEYLKNENFDIPYPANMPEQYRVKYITVDYQDEEHWNVCFTFYGWYAECYQVERTPYAYTNIHKNLATEEYTVDDRTFYIRPGRKTNLVEYYLAFHTTDTLVYYVKTRHRALIDIILNATAGT